jgi:hypothetical protein
MWEKAKKVPSVQGRFSDQASSSYFFYIDSMCQQADSLGAVGSPQRDQQLRKIWRLEPMMKGTLYTIISKIVSLPWTIKGLPRATSTFTDILQQAENGAGWDVFIAKWVLDYLTMDCGAYIEIGRSGKSGPVAAIYNLDGGKCRLTGKQDTPVEYLNTTGNIQLDADSVVHRASLPSADEAMLNAGFCFVSRAIDAAQLLIALHRFEADKFRDMPPRGIALTQLSQPQVMKAMELYQAKQASKDLTFPGLLWMFGVDPATGLRIEPFAQPPAYFDRREVVETYAKILALCAGMDVGEIWLVQQTGATKATGEVQAQKAKGKGLAELITTIERMVNWDILPAGLEFGFDFPNDEQDLFEQNVKQSKINTVMALYKPPDGNTQGLVSRAYAQQNLVEEGLLDADRLQEMLDDEEKQAKAEAEAAQAKAAEDAKKAELAAQAQAEAEPAAVETSQVQPGGDDGEQVTQEGDVQVAEKQADLEAQIRKMPEWRRKMVKQRVKDWKDAEAKMLDRKEARFLEGESAKP